MVLVILGLLAGSIIAGQSIINGGKIRSDIASMTQYQTAYNNFYQQYNAVPGDMKDATSYWGTAGGNGYNAACIAAQTQNNTATCNGTNDGQISSSTNNTYGERFLGWKHLANSGLIAGNYTGKTDGSANSWVPNIGVNMPGSKIKRGVFDLNWMAGGGSHVFDSNVYSNGVTLHNAVLTPQEALTIDNKLDDGKPAYGRVISTKRSAPTSPNCTTSDDASTAEYDISTTARLCVSTLLF